MIPPTPIGNLPEQLTAFIGRAREIAEVTRLLGTSRLLTLTGTGGTGKTRLALQVARQLSNAPPDSALRTPPSTFADGIWLVELATLAGPSLLPQALAAVLGVREEPGRDLVSTLAAYLQPLDILLVLDNCEHVRAACASLVVTLLRACPDLHIMATSREPLGVPGEVCWSVPPLSAPDPRQHDAPESLGQYEAVQLFVDRARLRRTDFALTSANARAVSEICYRLDGIPLALELAAARVRVLSVEQIVDRLAERFRLLTSANHGTLPRQRTLEALLDWSYDLLNEEEKALLRGLSVFSGGFELEEVQAVCAAAILADEYELIDLLSRLVDKSLVMAEEQRNKTRYRMLETMRQYANEKLRSSGHLPAMRDRHLARYLQLIEESQEQLLTSNQGVWLETLEREHDNLRAALAWSLSVEHRAGARDGSPQHAALRLAGSLVWFWYFRGYLSEGRIWLESAIANADSEAYSAEPGAGDTTRERYLGVALAAVGALAFLQSDYAPARSYLERGLATWEALGDRRGKAYVLTFLGRVRVRQGEPEAVSLVEESVQIFREINDTWGLALSLDFLGEVARDNNDEARAATLHSESLAIYRQIGNPWGIALEISNFGRVALQEGDYVAARSRLEQALDMQRQIGDKRMVAWTLHNLGELMSARGDVESAFKTHIESLALSRELVDKGLTSVCLESLAGLWLAVGQPERAARLLSAASALRQAVEPEAARLSGAGPVQERFPGAWSAGRSMPLDEMFAYASQVPDRVEVAEQTAPGKEEVTPSEEPQPGPFDLSRREVEVLRLVAEGLTDAQIAERLYLSARTVQAHIRSIYSKINITTRSAATRYALEHGFL